MQSFATLQHLTWFLILVHANNKMHLFPHIINPVGNFLLKLSLAN